MRSNQLRILFVSLLAVFAVSAIASATASAAAPEFIRCVKVKVVTEPSSFKDAECKSPEKGKGKYIRVSVEPGLCNKVAPGEPFSFEKGCAKAGGEYAMVEKEAKRKFTDKEGTSHFYATGKGGAIVFTCTADTSKGEITGNTTTAGVTVTFTGCTAKEGTKESCSAKSKGEPAGTIKTNGLKDTLGTVAKAEAASEVGDALEPEGKEGFVTLEAACLEVKTQQVSGSVIGEVKPINVLQTAGELIFECEPAKSTTQKIQRFVGAEKDTLSAFGKAACFESKAEITYEEPIEVT